MESTKARPSAFPFLSIANAMPFKSRTLAGIRCFPSRTLNISAFAARASSASGNRSRALASNSRWIRLSVASPLNRSAFKAHSALSGFNFQLATREIRSLAQARMSVCEFLISVHRLEKRAASLDSSACKSLVEEMCTGADYKYWDYGMGIIFLGGKTMRDPSSVPLRSEPRV